MSRHRRKARTERDNPPRHLPPWKCLKCGAPMQREVSEAARAAARVAMPFAVRRDVIEVCGGCRAWHIPTSDGMLRLATDAEIFETRMEAPEACDAAEHLEPGHLVIQKYKVRP
jgi:hypothetical protein